MYNYKKFLFSIISLFVLFLPVATFALELEYPSVFGLSINNSSTITDFVKYFFNLGIILSTFLASGVIAFGGISWLISFGTGKFISEGKEWLKAGVTGLIIIMSSYLIMSAINPELVVLKIGNLLPISAIFSNTNSSTNNQIPTAIYNEIPIGTLTENLLTETISCYEFDMAGDPIYNKVITNQRGTIDGPTFLNNDRLDCILKLGQAVQSKAKVIEKLSKKITAIMNNCQCSSEKGCGNSSDQSCNTLGPDALVREDGTCSGYSCGGPFKCSCQPETYCSISGQDEYKMCRPGDKNLIESGPIKIDTINLEDFTNIFGSDSQVGNLFSCMNPKISQGKDYKGLNEFRSIINKSDILKTVEETILINQKQTQVIKKDVWNNLRLADQVSYLKEKINQIQQDIQKDKNKLQTAGQKLNSKDCSYAKSYVDFLNIQEQNDNKKNIIKVNKYSDDLSISRYCQGFEYANSSCYSTCENICPSFSLQATSCYSTCENITNIANKKQCQNNCFDQSPCLFGNSQDYSNFKGCVSTCQNQCSTDCSKKFKVCSEIKTACQQCSTGSDNGLNCQNIVNNYCQDEYDKCQSTCQNNSKCVLDNKQACLFNQQTINNCQVNQIDPTDSGNIEQCSQTSFLCKYGSDQFAGYQDCLNQANINKDFSSSSLFQNQSYQLCPAFTQTSSGSRISDNLAIKNCIQNNQETAKCPTASACPTCPCTDIKSETKNWTYGQGNIQETTYQVVGATCQKTLFNDDPLTFYCKTDPLKNDADVQREREENGNLGKDWVADKVYEIPVGQTIDSSIAWANKITPIVEDFNSSAQALLDYFDTIKKENNYCECGSTCSETEATCNSSCASVPALDPEGKLTGLCACQKQSCSGNPCQKMINLLNGKSSKTACPINVEYKSPNYYTQLISDKLNIMKDFVTTSRSDILKQLVYTRNQINQCSVKDRSATEDLAETRMVSCTMANANIVNFFTGEQQKTLRTLTTTINGRKLPYPCYGKELSNQVNKEISDNWFCLSKYSKK